MNFTAVFSARFNVRAGESPVLNLVGYGAYRIRLNGQFVGFGPARGPKGKFRPDTWSLDGLVRAGDNELTVEVNGPNVNSFYLMDQRPFLKAEVAVGGRVLARTGTDGDFVAQEAPRVRRAPRYSFQRTFAEIWRLPGGMARSLALERRPDPTLIDRLAPLPKFEVRNDLRPVFRSDLRWNAQKLTRTDRCLTLQTRGFKGYPTNELYRNTFDDLQRFETVAHRKTSEAERKSRAQRLGRMQSATYDLGMDDSGFPGLTVRCEGPTVLYLTWDEVLTDGLVKGKERQRDSACGIIWELAAAGTYELDAFDSYTMRYLDVIVAEGAADVSNVRFRSYKSPWGGEALFQSSDPDLDAVFSAAVETFRQNSVDVFTDCPGRERGGWLCDSYFTAPAATLLSGNADLEKLFMGNFALASGFDDIPDGMLPMCYPADHPDGVFIPNWAMWFVLQADEYLRRSGDVATIEKLRPRLVNLIEFLWKYRNADGLLERLPGWVFVEWSEANKLVMDVSYPSNMLWAETLDAMARLFGRVDLSAEAVRVRETVRRQAWTGTAFCDNAVRGQDGRLRPSGLCSETCQYYALFTHVADATRDADFTNRMIEDFGPLRKAEPTNGFIRANAFIGDYLRLKVLERLNRGERLVRECKALFADMARRTGTLWEHETEQASCCHGFASFAACTLVRGVAGIEVDGVAKTLRLHETDTRLPEIRVTLPVGDRQVSVVRKWRDGRASFAVSLPPTWCVKGDVDHAVACEDVPVSVTVGAGWRVSPETDDPVVRHAAESLANVLSARTKADIPVSPAGGAGPAISIAVGGLTNRLTSVVEVSTEGIRISGAMPRETAQGCYRLEDMLCDGDGTLPVGRRSYTRLFSPRMTHSSVAVGDYPDEELERIARAGMDAVLVYVKAPGVSKDGKTDLNDLVRRAALRGLDVYGYACDAKAAADCDPTAPDAEQQYGRLYGSITRNVPGLRGMVFVGESCAFRSKLPGMGGFWWKPEKGKHMCGFWPGLDWVDWLAAVKRATRAERSDFDVVFWTYNWFNAPKELRLELLENIPSDVSTLVTFEMGDSFGSYKGVPVKIDDYSISRPGPSSVFTSEAEVLGRRGVRLMAMANAGGRTWDFGGAPYVPAPYLWLERFKALRRAHDQYGLSGLMDSHHFGWHPGVIAELAKECFTAENSDGDLEARLQDIAARRFGKKAASKVLQAWCDWSEAMRLHSANSFDQYGPLRVGPSYPFTRPGEPRPPKPRGMWAFLQKEYWMPKGSLLALQELAKRELDLWTCGIRKLQESLDIVPSSRREAAKRHIALGQFCAASVRTMINAREFYRGALEKDNSVMLEAIAAEERNVRESIPVLEQDSTLGREPAMGIVVDGEHLRWKLDQLNEERSRIRREVETGKKAL